MKKTLLASALVFTAALFMSCNPQPEIEPVRGVESDYIKMIEIPGADFYMAETEVTYGQRLKIEPNSGCYEYSNKNEAWPATMKLLHALQYCNGLSEKMGYEPVYAIETYFENDWSKEKNLPSLKKVTINNKANGYRLPTPEEWIYAAKGGKDSVFDSFNDFIDHASVFSKTCRTEMTSTKKCKPNAYGLYDMFGNVAEVVIPSEQKTVTENEVNDLATYGHSWKTDPETAYNNLFEPKKYSDYRWCGYRIVRNK